MSELHWIYMKHVGEMHVKITVKYYKDVILDIVGASENMDAYVIRHSLLLLIRMKHEWRIQKGRCL